MKSLGLGAAALVAALPFATQADTTAEVKAECAGCHALQSPDYAALGVRERIARKGPPLHYAGNKFRREWLVTWLQNPSRIRPAGVFPPAHVRTTPDGEVIDESGLPKHPALPASRAEAVADYLMGLKPFDDRLKAQNYQPGSIALRLGQMNFGKFKACDACHQDAPGQGGVSGPELYTAWQRLQPAFISAYIADPVAWDPHAMMPKGDLNADSVHKLANYLKAVGENQR